MTEFRLPAAMRDEIIAHARQEKPRECCGVIIGPPGEPTELRRMTNIYEGIDFYEIDGRDYLKLQDELDGRGWDLIAVYHSHPVSPAKPSARDIEYAALSNWVHIICSLEDDQNPVVNAFFIDGDLVTDLPITA